MRTKTLLIGFSFLAVIFMPLISLGNGGDQRVVDNKYFINLSRAPFTPRVGVKDSMLASFFDIQANRLIAEDLIVRIRVSQLGGVGGKRTFIFEKDNVEVRGGVLEFPYIFNESGLHEIFFDFAFASNPKKVYEVPDFLIDVQKPEVPPASSLPIWLSGTLGIIGGLVVGLFLKGKRTA